MVQNETGTAIYFGVRLQITVLFHIIQVMNISNLQMKIERATRWLVPAAALLALAAWVCIAPEGALGKMDAIGYAVCHRIDARSFHIEGRQLPLCARCSGEFYAAGAGLIFQMILSGKRSRLPNRGIIAVFFLLFLAFGIDGSNSYLYLLKQTHGAALINLPNLYTPNNTLRLFTGSGMGIVLAGILYPIIHQTLWVKLDPRPALEWKSLAGLTGLITGINFLILSEHPAILLPIAYLSALGTLSLLVIVFAMLWIIIMRQDNTFEKPGKLWLALLAGFTLAMLMVLGIDLMRLTMTGTWSGFPGLSG